MGTIGVALELLLLQMCTDERVRGEYRNKVLICADSRDGISVTSLCKGQNTMADLSPQV